MNDLELLHAYLDGELAPEEKARIENALASNPELVARLQALRSVDRALETLPGHATTDDFTERVLTRARRSRRGWIYRLGAPLAAAAAILVAVLLYNRTPENGEVFTYTDYLEYVWEADAETYGSLNLADLQDAILKELDAT